MGIECYALKTDESPSLHRINIPNYYRECISALQDLNKKGRETSMLWGNNAIRIDGNVIEFAHWSRVGIKFMRDIFIDGDLQENVILNKLEGTARANFFTDLVRFKRATQIFVNNYLEGIDTPILENVYTTKENKTKKLADLTFKEMLGILRKKEPDHTWANKVYWSQKFMYEPFDPGKIFKFIFKDAETPRKPREFGWKIFFNQVNVEKKLKLMRLSDGVCKMCLAHEEDLEHMLIGCQGLNVIWARIIPLIKIALPNILVTIDIFHFGLMSENKLMNTIVNTVLSIARWNIWKRRCTYKYDDKLISIESCLSIILKDIAQHLDILKKQNRFANEVSKIKDTIP